MESGQLESPNYPEDYQANKECIWRVSVPVGFQVALKFQSFEIENHDNCVYDYIEIRDGGDETAPKLGAFCGYKASILISSCSIRHKFDFEITHKYIYSKSHAVQT